MLNNSRSNVKLAKPLTSNTSYRISISLLDYAAYKVEYMHIPFDIGKLYCGKLRVIKIDANISRHFSVIAMRKASKSPSQNF